MIKLANLLDTKNTAGICIFHECKVLLIRKAEEGHWEIPKGHIREGEDTFDGAVRETYEETQIIVNTTKWLDEVHKGKNKENGDFTIFRYDVDEPVVPILSEEHNAWRYFCLKTESLPEPMYKEVEKYLKKVKRTL